MKQILWFLVIMACISCAFAQGNELNARYTHLQCRQNLVATQLTELGKYTTITGAEQVSTDMGELQRRLDSENKKDFNNYIKNTVSPDFKTLAGKIKTARNSIKGKNVSKDDKKALIAAWKDAISTFSQCNTNAQKEFVAARKLTIDSDLNKWNAEIQKMKAKGLDTTAMESIITEANLLSTKLEDASTAADDATFKTKMDAIRDLHLHIWARFHIARLESYLANLTPVAEAKGFSTGVKEIEELLASSTAMAAPGTKYKENGFEQIWQNIKLAQTKIQELSKAVKQ